VSTPPVVGIPIEKAVRFGWDTFKNNVEFVLAVEIAAFFAIAIVNWATALMETISGYHEVVIAFADFVLSMIVNLGAIKIALKYRDGEKVEFANLFDSFGILPAFIAAAVLTALAVGIGLMFLIIPGIIIAVRFCFYGFFVIDEDAGPIDAIHRSVRLTEGVGFDLFLFAMLLAGINFLGVLALGLGLFVSIPVSILATAYVYRDLEQRRARGGETQPPQQAPPAG
jgi:uncharacterized membrane protein